MSQAVKKNLHYAWVVAAVTFLTLLVTAGIRSTPGVLIVPIEHEFGWSRATISIAITLLALGVCATTFRRLPAGGTERGRAGS